jgi:hypothetical protein
MQTIQETWSVKVFHKSHKIVLCRIVDSHTTGRLSLWQVAGVVEEERYQFLARGVVKGVLHYYLNSHRIFHRTSHKHVWGCHRICRPPEGLALKVPVGVDVIAGIEVVVREQPPEKEVLRALLAERILRIAMPRSSCRTLPMAGQPLSHIHDRMSL